MQKRNERREKTRQRIMVHARRLYQERGFRRVSVEELCSEMGMSKRTFYRYFPDREALVMALVAESVTAHAPRLVENLTSDRPVDEILKRHFSLLVDDLFANVSIRFMRDVQLEMPEVWERIEQFRKGVGGIMVELFRRGQREGTIRPDIDPEVAGKLLQGILTHLANPEFVMQQGLGFEQFISAFRNLLLHGVLSSKKKEGEG